MLETALSPERISPYRNEADGDLRIAVRLYEWNAAISAAWPLTKLHNSLLTITEWIDPGLRDWVKQQSTVSNRLTERPKPSR
jgi:hypothetical protein